MLTLTSKDAIAEAEARGRCSQAGEGGFLESTISSDLGQNTSSGEWNPGCIISHVERLVNQHDIKKREVQLERTLQHWQRVSSENARLLSAGYRTGLTRLNPIEAPEQVPRVVSHYQSSASPSEPRTLNDIFNQDSLFDPSIRELDHQIISLQEECEAFRHVTLSTANQLLKLEAIAKQEAVRCHSMPFTPKLNLCNRNLQESMRPPFSRLTEQTLHKHLLRHHTPSQRTPAFGRSWRA